MTPLLGGASASSMEEGTSTRIGEVVREQISSQNEEMSQGENDISQVATDEEQLLARKMSAQLALGITKAQDYLVETWKVCSLSSSLMSMVLY